MDAWHADSKEFKRGTFRTSQDILAKQCGMSVRKLKSVLDDLSYGENPEISYKTKKGYVSGYTEITILNYNKYQSNTNVTESNTNVVQSNTTFVQSNTNVVRTKEEERRIDNKREHVVTNSLFLERLNKYPKPLNDFDLKSFNNLNDLDKEKIANFASSMGKIWNEYKGEKPQVAMIKKIETVITYYLSNNNYIDGDNAIKNILNIRDYVKPKPSLTYEQELARIQNR